jgi:cell division protein FtsW (lipid II flippase)
MYERELGFVNSYGCVFQECISKSPMRAIERMQPIILLGTMLGFLHKCVLAFFMGRFAHKRKSWVQLGALVCPTFLFSPFHLCYIWCSLLPWGVVACPHIHSVRCSGGC